MNLVDGYLCAGTHSVTFNPAGFSPGLYRVLMESGNFHDHGDVLIQSQVCGAVEEYTSYMQTHWSENAYFAYIDSTYFGMITEEEFGWHTLPEMVDGVYYELIGKSLQFVSGWDDFQSDTTYQTYGNSVNQAEYLLLWQEAHGN